MHRALTGMTCGFLGSVGRASEHGESSRWWAQPLTWGSRRPAPKRGELSAEEDTWGGRCKRRPLEFLRCMRREAAGKRKQPTIEGERKSEAPDLGLAVWRNEAHRKKKR